MFGKLTLSAFIHGHIETAASLTVVGAAIVSVLALLYFKKLGWLWHEWLTSLDPKKIGIMYIVLAVIMGMRGFIDAAMMRTQQAVAADAPGFLPPDHFDQLFTAHGVIMIFFLAMPFMFGIINLIVPLQIGARDVAFPFVNSLSFWLTAAAAMLLNMSLVAGEFAAVGWLAYPPLSEIKFSPGVGVDYYIWVLQLSGIATLLSAINFIVTILKMRAPGMTLMRMPIFIWTVFGSMLLILFTFPILTATISMLFLDRFAGMHFFTTDLGGNMMLYVNLIWAWGHPEVYILMLPCFGIFSEVVPVFSQKRLFGYTSMVIATMVIVFLSFVVWLHHFFTMGAGANVNSFFGIMTMVISIPTGVKVFNWIFTMFRGRIIFRTPFLWFMGFAIVFAIGGMTGVLLAIPGADFELHNSLFLIAHFHNMVIGGVVFGLFSGMSYWFPKFFGFRLNERFGVYAFWCWVVGFAVAFVPIYIAGLMGMTRRLTTYSGAFGWHPLLMIALVGVGILALGVVFQVIQFILTFTNKEKLRDDTGDPWNGRTLEWATASPVPVYNFAIIPTVDDLDALYAAKQRGSKHEAGSGKASDYEDIYLPKNTAIGLYVAGASFVLGFAMVWHILWVVPLMFAAIVALLIYRALDEHTEYCITAAEVAKIESTSSHWQL
jgi:cytochrome o ubiquinol oxidase subunit 1